MIRTNVAKIYLNIYTGIDAHLTQADNAWTTECEDRARILETEFAVLMIMMTKNYQKNIEIW